MWRYYAIFGGLLAAYTLTFWLMMVEAEGQALATVESARQIDLTRMEILEDGMETLESQLHDWKEERAEVRSEVAELKEELRRLKK